MANTLPTPLNLTLTVLRLAQGWSQKELARAAGIPGNLLSDYERGRKTLSRQRLEHMAAILGLPADAVDATLGFMQTLRSGPQPLGPGDPRDPQAWRIETIITESGRLTSEFARSMFSLWRRGISALEARREAKDLWRRMKRYEAPDRPLLVEKAIEFRSWALCELICEESVKAAGDSADRAVELAELALYIADLAPGDEAWRSRLQGYAWAHVGNARRVRGDLPGADEAFARSQRLWETGSSSDPKLLDEARVLGLKASLRRDQRRLAESLDLVDQALMEAQGRETTYLILNKAKLLEELGDFEEAITTLCRAAPLIEAENEPRFLFALRFNLAVNYCFLGHYGEAERLWLQVCTLAPSHDNELDSVRLRWLEGRIAAGLGKRERALVALSRVREAFATRGIAYDTALASLELAVLYLEEGHTGQVKAIARQMTPIFQAQGVHREALAALRLFREAAERETVTLDFTRRLVNYLQRAQYNPDLRFEDA